MRNAATRWRAIAERVFPEDARLIELLSPEGENTQRALLASWRLGTDPGSAIHSKSYEGRREPAISEDKVIARSTSQRHCVVHRAPNVRAQHAADERFEDWLLRELQTFEWDHHTPNGHEPPVVPSVIETIALNG